jgi:hypothetical protein
MDRPHTRSIGINDFIRWRDEETLVLSPKFQRRIIWPKKAKAFLVDTVIRGMPVPKLYMRQHIDLRSSKTIHEVVDGQQRLTALIEFRDDLLRLSQETEYPGAKFSQLPKDAQKAFLTYELTVDLLVDAADADVLDIFARINSHSFPLNAQEKRNGRYFGSFKSTAYSLGFQHLEFWKKHKILTDTSIARMKEAELTSELIVGMTAGLQDKKKSIDGFYKKWDDRFPYRQKSKERFREVIDLLETHLGSVLINSNFRRPALFYSLFLSVYQLRFGELGDMSSTKVPFGEREGAKLRKAIEVLDTALRDEVSSKAFATFVTASQRQTDNIAPRRIRQQAILREYKSA